MTYAWHNDCGWIGMLDSPMFDHTFTDCPYDEYVYQNSRRTRTGRETFDLGHKPLTDAQIALACYAIALRTRRWAILFLDIERGVPRWRAGLEAHGMRYMGTGIWHKEPYTPQMTGDRGAQNYEAYLIMHAAGASKWNGGGLGVCFKHPPAPTVKNRHQTEKPIGVMEYLIRLYTDRGDTIAEPFGGRATTVAAAIRTGRIAAGWECINGIWRTGKTRLEATHEPVQLLTDEDVLESYGRKMAIGGKTESLFTKEQMHGEVAA